MQRRGQVQGKCAALADPALYADFSAQGMRKLSADRESQSGPAIVAAGAPVGLLESLEYDLLLVGFDTDAGVGDGKSYRSRSARERCALGIGGLGAGYSEGDRTAFGELERIVQQVAQYLVEALLIRRDCHGQIG